MTYSNLKSRFWSPALLAVGLLYAWESSDAGDVARGPSSCIEGIGLAEQGDHMGALLSWKDQASDLSLKEGTRKVLFCLPSLLYSDDPQEMFAWLRKAAASGNADAEAIAGLIFLSVDGDEISIEEGLSLLRRASEKGHDGAQFTLYLYESENRVGGNEK